MTDEEMLSLGKLCLAEYEPLLQSKVLGPIEPWRDDSKRVETKAAGPLDLIDEEVMRHEISRALDMLVAVKFPFVMSEPDPQAVGFLRVETVVHGVLNLNFIRRWKAPTGEQNTHIVLWYREVLSTGP